MAVEDEELYALFIRHLSFETSFGDMKMADILRKHSSILVTASLDEFRQVSRVAKYQNLMVVNGGYVNDLDLVRNVTEVDDNVSVNVLNVLEFANRFEELNAEEKQDVQPFLERSDRLLESYQCRSLVRWFDPADIPVLYNTNQEVNFFKLAEESEKEADPLFGDVVRIIKSEMYERSFAQLCYNFNNPIVRKAIDSRDPQLWKACIELFYTQALLLGNHPMGQIEMRMMNESLLQFMNRGLDAVTEVDQ
jgi:molecular chaperone HtpG